MDEFNFKKWLQAQGVASKMQSDIVSRIKRFERAIPNFDIDDQYCIDRGDYLLSLFENKGTNDNMKEFGEVDLPIGKYQLSVIKYALNKYIKYIRETSD